MFVQTPAPPKQQAPAGGTEEPADSFVIVLDDASFTLHVNAHPVTMVEFYAPWCVPLFGARSLIAVFRPRVFRSIWWFPRHTTSPPRQLRQYALPCHVSHQQDQDHPSPRTLFHPVVALAPTRVFSRLETCHRPCSFCLSQSLCVSLSLSLFLSL